MLQIQPLQPSSKKLCNTYVCIRLIQLTYLFISTITQLGIYNGEYIIIDMKYLCKSCKTTCDDIIKHVKKVHGFSESYIKEQLKTNSNSYLNAFEKIK